jgi:hypothetical protein
MNRAQLEHVIRAAAAISGDDEIIIVGSQSILGQFPSAPAELCKSNEADVYPKNKPDMADLVDGSIGELSPFHDTFGYYAQGVGPETATLPAGWQSRLIAVSNANTRGAIGWCLEAHDLVLSKYVAWREKDREFVRVAIQHRLVDVDELLRRVDDLPVDESRRTAIRDQIDRDVRT